LAESLTVNGEIVFEDDIDRNAMAEYVNVLVVIDGALRVAVRPDNHCEEHLDMVKERPAPVQEQRPYAYANPYDLSADTAFRWCEINEYTMPVYTTPAAQPAPVSNETMQKLREKLESPSYTHALAYQNIREALEIVMRWIDDYCETGPENDFERVEKIANAALEVTPPAAPVQPAAYRQTGWAAHRDQYAVPVLFNPYTGQPRDVRDVQSDPQGILIVPPGKVEMRGLKPTHQQGLQVATPPAAQRQWAGLTDEDKLQIEIMGGKSDVLLAEMVETKLKGRNA
jgi:hypothetical protein